MSAAVVLLALIVLGAGSAVAAPRAAADACAVQRSAGHAWIVVTKGVSCATGTRVVRALAARTARLGHGRTAPVASPVRGYTCVLRNLVKPSGACVKGTAHTIVWLVAA